MTRWLAILFRSIALCCAGTLAFAQLAGAAPQGAVQVVAQVVAQTRADEAPGVPERLDLPDGQDAPAPAEPASPDMPFDLPELFDSRLAALPLGAGSAALPPHAPVLLGAPFIEGPQRPPRAFGTA